jgi:hypothetical protein
MNVLRVLFYDECLDDDSISVHRVAQKSLENLVVLNSWENNLRMVILIPMLQLDCTSMLNRDPGLRSALLRPTAFTWDKVRCGCRRVNNYIILIPKCQLGYV